MWRRNKVTLEKSSVKAWSRDDFFALGFALIVYAVFNLLLVNKFFPITEGWFQDAANYINSGALLYQDFYMFIPPGFPLLTAVISKLSGNVFLVFRLIGILERLLMLALVYRILRRLFTPMVGAISALTGAVLYIANIQEIFYGYYQSSLFVGLIGVWLCIRMYETFERKPYVYAVLFGVCAALSFMIKQTLGLLLSLAIGVMFIAAVYFLDPKKMLKTLGCVIAGCVSFFAVAIGLMAVLGIFEPFVQQVFGGASSKGSLAAVLFGFLPRIMTQNAWTMAGLFLAFYGLSRVREKMQNDEVRRICDVGQWASLLISGIWLFNVLLKAFSERERTYPLTWEYAGAMLIGLFILLVGCLCMCAGEKSARYRIFAPCILLVGFTSLFWIISSFEQNLINYSQIRDFRQHLIFAVFLAEFIASVYLLYQVAVKKDASKSILLIICVASWSVMYIHGFSYTIEDHSTFLSVALFMGYLLSAKVRFESAKRILAITFAAGIILTVFYQRNWFTYHWWGVGMTNTTYEATETFDDPHLKGIYANSRTTEPMNEIYAQVEKYKTEDSTLFSFPHIAYFNVMSELPSPTFSKTHYFDVCSDAQAIADAQVLLQSKPDFIVWMEMPEETWVIHEEAFRAGMASGQRQLAEAYQTLVESGEYTLLGIYTINYSDPIYLWVRTKIYC